MYRYLHVCTYQDQVQHEENINMTYCNEIMVGSFKIVFNQSCFLSVENNNMFETNVLPKEEITNADIFL